MRITILAVLVLTTACSGTDDKPAPCSLAHRSGTYVAHFTERASGNCGPIADQVVSITTGGGLPPGCAFDADDVVSSDECSLTRSSTCPLDGVPGTVSVVGITTEHDGGKSFSGVTTAHVHDGAGTLQCSSTYDIAYSKQ